MKESVRYLWKFVQYLYKSKHRRGFGIHSPSLFYVVTMIIEDKNPYYCFERIEGLRRFLKKSGKTIPCDWKDGEKERKVSDLIQSQNFSPAYDQLLFRLVNHYKPQTVLELGDTIGLSTLYLASSDHNMKVVSVGGSENIIQFARQVLEKNKVLNVEFKKNITKEAFRAVGENLEEVDFLYFGRMFPADKIKEVVDTLECSITSRTVMVVSDIYKTKQKELMWDVLKKHPKVRVSVEMFHYGILLCDENLQKEDYNLFFLPWMR